VKAAEPLSEKDFYQFTLQVLALHAKRIAIAATQEEAQLLLRINGRLPDDVQTAMRIGETAALIAKRREVASALTMRAYEP
jgi:hypothetical protein